MSPCTLPSCVHNKDMSNAMTKTQIKNTLKRHGIFYWNLTGRGSVWRLEIPADSARDLGAHVDGSEIRGEKMDKGWILRPGKEAELSGTADPRHY